MGYPPERHVLRDLDFEVETVSADRHLARYSPGGDGPTEVGGILTVVDLLAGTLCIAAIAPDWMATSGLSFHLSGSVPAGELLLSAQLVRAGRNTVVVEVDATLASTGERIGEGMVTFSRLVRRDSNQSLEGAHLDPGATFSFPSPDPVGIGAGGSLRRAIGCAVLDRSAGVTETGLDPYVRNSFGAMNGGVVATVVESAARAYGEVVLGAGLHLTDVVLHYLSQGRVGPVRSEVSLVRGPAAGSATSGSLRVEVVDAGASVDRLMVLAHVGVAVTPDASVSTFRP